MHKTRTFDQWTDTTRSRAIKKKKSKKADANFSPGCLKLFRSCLFFHTFSVSLKFSLIFPFSYFSYFLPFLYTFLFFIYSHFLLTWPLKFSHSYSHSLFIFPFTSPFPFSFPFLLKLDPHNFPSFLLFFLFSN